MSICHKTGLYAIFVDGRVFQFFVNVSFIPNNFIKLTLKCLFFLLQITYTFGQDHRSIHTGEKPYACKHCTSNFRTMSSFYSHLRKIHGKSTILYSDKISLNLWHFWSDLIRIHLFFISLIRSTNKNSNPTDQWI